MADTEQSFQLSDSPLPAREPLPAVQSGWQVDRWGLLGWAATGLTLLLLVAATGFGVVWQEHHEDVNFPRACGRALFSDRNQCAPGHYEPQGTIAEICLIVAGALAALIVLSATLRAVHRARARI